MVKKENCISDFQVIHYMTKFAISVSCFHLHTFFIALGNFPFNIGLGPQWKMKIALVILKLYTKWQKW